MKLIFGIADETRYAGIVLLTAGPTQVDPAYAVGVQDREHSKGEVAGLFCNVKDLVLRPGAPANQPHRLSRLYRSGDRLQITDFIVNIRAETGLETELVRPAPEAIGRPHGDKGLF